MSLLDLHELTPENQLKAIADLLSQSLYEHAERELTAFRARGDYPKSVTITGKEFAQLIHLILDWRRNSLY